MMLRWLSILTVGVALTTCGDTSTPSKKPNDGLDLTGESLEDESPVELRGLIPVNEFIKSYMVANDDFELGRYLDKSTDEEAYFQPERALSNQLGTVRGNGSQRIVRGQTPSALSVMLWYLAIDQFAKDIQSFCGPVKDRESAKVKKLIPEFQELIQKQCKGQDKLGEFYDLIMNYKGDADHKKRWLEFQKSQKQSNTIHSIILTLMFHPEFLSK